MTRKNNNTNNRSTMKYLTMVLALAPGIAAFSGAQRMTVKSSASSGYRDSDASSTISTYILRRSSEPRRSSSRLHYISGADHEHTANQTTDKKEGASWWPTIFSREQTSAADDYLEFLDRRYNRILHEEDDTKGFSVMNWLNQGASGEARDRTQKQNEEDALHVLGVANLASKSFLQKHHMIRPEDTTSKTGATSTAAIDAEIVEVSRTPKLVTPIVEVIHQVALRRKALVRSQTRGARMALFLTLKSLITGPKRAAIALRKLFDMGGGKRSMALTFAAVAALSFLLRPLIKVAASEGANTVGL